MFKFPFFFLLSLIYCNFYFPLWNQSLKESLLVLQNFLLWFPKSEDTSKLCNCQSCRYLSALGLQFTIPKMEWNEQKSHNLSHKLLKQANNSNLHSRNIHSNPHTYGYPVTQRIIKPLVKCFGDPEPCLGVVFMV